MNESTDKVSQNPDEDFGKEFAKTIAPATPIDPAENAKNWADGIKWVAWIVAVLGVIGGIMIGSQTVGYDEHPYAGYGIGVAIGSVMSGVVIGGLSVLLSSVAAVLKRESR